MSHNAQNMRLWLDALRSGEFQQVRGSLLRDGRYCCLGVACEVFRRKTGEGKWGDASRGDAGRFQPDVGEDSGMWLPPAVQRWLGVGSNDPAGVSRDNDEGESFGEIAGKLEAEYPCR